MKFAFTNLACPTWTMEQVADAAPRMGYDGVELRLLGGNVIDPSTESAQVGEAVALIRSRGVALCAFDTSCRFNFADARARAEQVAVLRQWIRLARTLDVPVVRVFGGAAPTDQAVSEDESNGWVIDALRMAAPDAEQAKVTVAVETHDAFSSARRVATVLDALSSPYVAALWDSDGTYRMGETAEDVIDLLGSRIAHVHVKDSRRVTPGSDTWELTLLGDGEIPIREQLHALERSGYAGYVSVEWEKKWHPEIAEPEVALPQHIAWLKTVVGSKE